MRFLIESHCGAMDPAVEPQDDEGEGAGERPYIASFSCFTKVAA